MESKPGDDAGRLLSGEAWRAWCDRLKAAGEGLLGDDRSDSPRDRAEGFRWLTRLVVHSLQMELEAGDPQHPVFVRYETPHNQWGGPNPDNLYLRANVDPGCAYRIWADVSGVRRAIFSLHQGDMQLGELGVYGETSLDQLAVGEGGRLEFWLSLDERPGNWLPMHPDGRLFTIRVYQSDWERDAAPVFHIERVGGEGVPRPPLEPAFVAAALERSAHWVEQSAAFWSRYTREGWRRATPNVPSPARETAGGAERIRYGSCFWELAEGEVLLLECAAPDADYWGFSIHTLGWLESGDFAERQTSLNGHQLHLDGDGRVRIALSAHDPGVPNWIDSEGRPRGLLVFRWAWARDNPLPSASVVEAGELRGRLPADHPVVDDAQRRRALARRRELAWNRFQ